VNPAEFYNALSTDELRAYVRSNPSDMRAHSALSKRIYSSDGGKAEMLGRWESMIATDTPQRQATALLAVALEGYIEFARLVLRMLADQTTPEQSLAMASVITGDDLQQLGALLSEAARNGDDRSREVLELFKDFGDGTAN